MPLFRPSFHWFSTRFVFDKPPSPEKLGEGPAEKADTLGAERRAVDDELGRLGDKAASKPLEAPVEHIHVDLSKEKRVDDWLKIDAAAKPLETKLNRFHETDRDDYVLFRMLSILPGFREDDVLSDGKPDMDKMRNMMANDDENGEVAKTFGFYWSGSDWAVIEYNADDNNFSEKGGFLNTFKNSILPDLRSETGKNDDDNPLSGQEVEDLKIKIDGFSREYDLLKNPTDPVLTSEDRKLDIYKDDTKKVVEELRSSKDWVSLSAPLLMIFQKHFIEDAGSYKFRLVSRGGKAYLYAIRFTNQQELPRLRILELGTEVEVADEKGKRKEIALSDRGFLNAASWNREVYKTDADAKPKLLDLIGDLPKAEADQERIRQLAGGAINTEVARQICERILANEKNFRYSFADLSSAALQSELKTRLMSKFNVAPYSVMNQEQRDKVAEQRAKDLVDAARLKIAQYDGGIFMNPDLISDEERAKLEVDFDFDAAEGIRIDPKGPALLKALEKAKEAREKGVAKVKDVTEDLSAIKDTMMGKFLLGTFFENEDEMKDALSGKDFFGHMVLGLFGIGGGKKAVSKLSEKHPGLSGFMDSMKGMISKMSGGLVEFHENVDKSKLALMESAGKKFEKDTRFSDAFKTSRELRTTKIIFGTDLNLTLNGSVQSFEEGKIYSEIRIPVGTILPKDTIVFKDSKFAEQVATSPSGGPGGSGTTSSSAPGTSSSGT